jgi:hypothetical protein
MNISDKKKAMLKAFGENLMEGKCNSISITISIIATILKVDI